MDPLLLLDSVPLKVEEEVVVLLFDCDSEPVVDLESEVWLFETLYWEVDAEEAPAEEP